MIAETIPGAYDAEGRKVFRPFDRRKGPRPTFPLGRYVSHPLTVKCNSIDDVRRFLKECKYVSDKELFGKDEYWQPPEEFEKRKKGDCEDFAFWTWRQLMNMGYDTRVVFGRAGNYGSGHAWVQFIRDEKCYVVESLSRVLGEFPRLKTLSYHPKFSVAWDGEKLTYYAHQDREVRPGFFDLARLVPEYISIETRFWLRVIPRMHRAIWNLLKHITKGFGWTK
jgi:hypothetical protein